MLWARLLILVLWFVASHALGATLPCEKPAADKPILIAHALGGIDGHTYTNSPEAFSLSLKQGFKWYETDLIEPRDGKIVAYHNLESMQQDLGIPGHIVDLEATTFLQQKYYRKYSTLDIGGVLRLLQSAPGICLILDLKDSRHRHQFEDLTHDPKQFQRLHKKVFAAVLQFDARLLARVVPQIYAPEDLAALNRLHHYTNVIFTLYRSRLIDDQVIRFVKTHKQIRFVAVDRSRFTENLAANLSPLGIGVLVYTVNDVGEMNRYLSRGVSGIYSDFISPASVRP